MKIILAALAVAALAIPALASAAPSATGAQASATPWVPGTSMYVTEKAAADLLETVNDHAYCVGVPRFGHRGEFPYEKFRIFDCHITTTDGRLVNERWKAIKVKRRGYWTLRSVRVL